MRLEGKIAVVTGAARGIGAAIAIRLAEEGADVACLDLRPGDSTVSVIQEIGRRGCAIATDVSDSASVGAACAEISRAMGVPTVVVNNAGIIIRKRALDYTDDDWDRTMKVNLLGQWHVVRHFARKMVECEEPGGIVNIASATALVPTYGRAAYIASKAAVVGMTKALALDLAEFDIRVNCVVPGATETEIWADYPADPEVYQQNLLLTPLRRWGLPSDVAAGVAFLSSPDAAHITGAVLAIDGGTSAGSPGGTPWPDLRTLQARPRPRHASKRR
jgi:NAD(P)-dependent dehydrogenase (short-subunit alcohol dehydrogenase family)